MKDSTQRRRAGVAPRLDEPEQILTALGEERARLVEDQRRLAEERAALTEERARLAEERVRLTDERDRLERELNDTNQGVVALYAELDDRAERLRLADEAKTRFLSGISHELRTPLNSILALAGLLTDHADGPLTPEQQRQVDYIRSAADELLVLVNNLLDLARIEAGRTPLSIAEFALPALLQSIGGGLRPLVRGKPVALVFEPADGLPSVHSDEGKVGQIVRNFVSNAVKYTERGEIRVRAELRPGGVMRIEVRDTGIGIAPEDQARIFEEFAQVPGPLQARTKGTGLGLPLCRALAAVLGGRVGVDSAPGAGSAFWLEMPLRHPSLGAEDGAPAADGTQPAATVAPTKPGTILVIDDDPVARYVVGQMLRPDGYRLVEAPGGIPGLMRAREDSPDLVILDLAMPDLDGWSVLARLRDDPATASIPVVVHSSQPLDEGQRRRLGPNAVAVVDKGPGDGRGLLAAVSAALRSAGRLATVSDEGRGAR